MVFAGKTQRFDQDAARRRIQLDRNRTGSELGGDGNRNTIVEHRLTPGSVPRLARDGELQFASAGSKRQPERLSILVRIGRQQIDQQPPPPVGESDEGSGGDGAIGPGGKHCAVSPEAVDQSPGSAKIARKDRRLRRLQDGLRLVESSFEPVRRWRREHGR